MKATELILTIQKLIEKHGDRQVFIDVGAWQDEAADFSGITFKENVKRYFSSSFDESQVFVTGFIIE